MIPWILLVVGWLLVYLEFYTPGGVFAVGGAISLLVALGMVWSQTASVGYAVGFLVLVVGGTLGVIALALWRIRRSSTFYHHEDQAGYQASTFDEQLIGKKGTALSDLGPSGFVSIAGVRYQATTRGAYIDKGNSIVVIGGEGAHLIVSRS